MTLQKINGRYYVGRETYAYDYLIDALRQIYYLNWLSKQYDCEGCGATMQSFKGKCDSCLGVRKLTVKHL